MIDRELLVQQIYEAAVFPEQWPCVLERLGEAASSPGVVLLTRRSDAWTGSCIAKPLEAAFATYLTSDIPAQSDTTRRLLAADHAGFLTDDDLFTPAEWAREPARRDWGIEHGWNHCAATAISVPTGDFLIFHAQRLEHAPSFNAADVATLDSYRPHLARAGLLAARLRLQRLRAATEALAMIGLPAAVLDRDGRALAANELVQQMTDHVRWLPRDRLALRDPIASELLQRGLANLFKPTGSSPNSFAARSATGDATVVHLIPTSGQARELFDGGLALLILTPVMAPDAPEAALIRGLFDLTAGEARVARDLTRGLSVAQIADAGGVTQATVRSQVKALLAKTGTSRQAEVTSLLAGLPKFRLQ
ncbi:MAG: LuxR family transcriptional regulator [Reyranella sp.]|uniref:response regulator transcription factor n=1 Tax=Reyranella sp. TaxID=1929291 RepID=UPI0011FEAEE6|nr:LuxR family transcriptional regulator [Reyranella sp.]TAJ84391.1 MAG: LuxR family transcriptional regulator [Reyranella sp.]TBR27351.1 MAG: LuxR family transcriptional regulator [Reyranella sp.]